MGHIVEDQAWFPLTSHLFEDVAAPIILLEDLSYRRGGFRCHACEREKSGRSSGRGREVLRYGRCWIKHVSRESLGEGYVQSESREFGGDDTMLCRGTVLGTEEQVEETKGRPSVMIIHYPMSRHRTSSDPVLFGSNNPKSFPSHRNERASQYPPTTSPPASVPRPRTQTPPR